MPNAYVIVGASLAGATAAVTLRQEGADGTITLIGAEKTPPYERPPLSKAYLRGETAFETALVRPPAFYAEQGIETIFGCRAVRIDASGRFVELDANREIVTQCKSGMRSARAAAFLREHGFKNVKNLKGGILAWVDQIDPSQPKY